MIQSLLARQFALHSRFRPVSSSARRRKFGQSPGTSRSISRRSASTVLRQCWLTFAPSLANGAAYTASEWHATFSNWQLTDPTDSVPALQVAGPGSVRIEENDAACTFTANWTPEAGFYSKYFANAASVPERLGHRHLHLPVHAQPLSRHFALWHHAAATPGCVLVE